MPDYQSLVERKLDPVGQSNNDVIYRCPKCEGDTGSGHLYVDYQKEVYNCFKCSFRGRRIESLLKYLNIDIGYNYDKLYEERDKELDQIINPQVPVVSEIVDYSNDLDVLTKYYALHTIPLTPAGYQYLLNRGLTPDMISRLQIREGTNRYGETFRIRFSDYIGRDYSGRIMVPSLRRDGRISFYVGRDYIGDKDAKYLNCPKELGSASEDVWNLDLVQSDSVIICEGVFTAIAASPLKMNAVATYGKSIAQRANTDNIRVTSQGEKLLDKHFKNYYICYDADAHEEAIKTCDYLYDRGANVYLVLIDPKKYGAKADIADIGYLEFVELMKQAIHYRGGLSIM